MSKNPTPPIGALIASLMLADLLSAKNGDAGSLPPGLKDLLYGEKCDDPTCGACNPATASAPEQQEQTATEEPENIHVSAAVEIPHEIAELVGMTKKDFDPDSLEGNTRLLAAAFILNVRKLGEQKVDTFPKAARTITGIRYVENTVLAALHTFSSLATK